MTCQEKNRVVYFDYLRVLATFAVIVLHVSASNWYVADVRTLEWQAMNIYDSAVRWSVPVFVMISGALFLGGTQDLKSIYGKYVLRMATAYIFWSAVYAAVSGGGFKKALVHMVKGHYHMWFIPMVVGLYICIPFIRKIVEDRKIAGYFLVLSFVFAFFLPQAVQLANDFGCAPLKTAANAFDSAMKNMNLHFVLGFTGYYIVGYYVSRAELGARARGIIYVLGALGVVMTAALNGVLSVERGEPVQTYYGNFTLNVLMTSLAIFVLVKYRTLKAPRINAFVARLSGYSFGAYLVHVLIIDQMKNHMGLHTLTFHPMVSVPVISLIVFAVSMAVSALIHQIPVLKKYIV